MLDRLIKWWNKWKKTNDNNDKETSESSLKKTHFTKWYEKEQEEEKKAKENRRSWLDAKTCGVFGSSIGLFFGGPAGAVLGAGLGAYWVSKIHDFIDRFHEFSDEDKEKYRFFKMYEDKFSGFYEKFCNSVGVDYNKTIEAQLLKIQESIQQCYNDYKEAIKKNPGIKQEEKIKKYIKENNRCLSEFVDEKKGFFETLREKFMILFNSNEPKEVVVDTTKDAISVLEEIEPKKAIAYMELEGGFLDKTLQQSVVEVLNKINENPEGQLKIKFMSRSDMCPNDGTLYLTEERLVGIYRYLMLKGNKLKELSKTYGFKEETGRVFEKKDEELFSKVITYETEKKKSEKHECIYYKQTLKNYDPLLIKKFGYINLSPVDRNVDTVYKEVEKKLEGIFEIEKKARAELQRFNKKKDKEIVSSNIKANGTDCSGTCCDIAEEDECLTKINNSPLDNKYFLPCLEKNNM